MCRTNTQRTSFCLISKIIKLFIAYVSICQFRSNKFKFYYRKVFHWLKKGKVFTSVSAVTKKRVKRTFVVSHQNHPVAICWFGMCCNFNGKLGQLRDCVMRERWAYLGHDGENKKIVRCKIDELRTAALSFSPCFSSSTSSSSHWQWQNYSLETSR